MGRRFVAQRRKDPYYRAAQAEGLRSRAAFKLEYLSDRFPIFRPGNRVLDLGAAPGGWSMVASERVGPQGAIVAVDPRLVEPIARVAYVRAKVGSASLSIRLGPEPFDVVLSDMSPSISGAYSTDHARSVALVLEAWALAQQVLKPGGRWVAKVFDGDLLADAEAQMKSSFDRWRRTKPPASREQSSELYLLGFGFHAPRASSK